MHIRYRKLVGVDIRHDYYLDAIDGSGITKWPKDYDINRDLDISPSPECELAMRNCKMIFKSSPVGFNVFVMVDPAKPDQGLVYLDPTVKLTFFIRIRNPYFTNFTNVPLISESKILFWFQNLTSNKLGTKLFISNTIPVFAPAAQYQYGDMVIHNSKVLEVIKNSPLDPATAGATIDCSKPVIPPAGAFWCESPINDARYVSTLDILTLQGNIFEYNSVNTVPGGLVTFTIRDVNGQVVLVDNVRNTGVSQTQYQASSDPLKPCHHRIDLSGIAPGKYTIDILKGGATETRTFYYIDPLRVPNVFAVIELFASAAVPVDYRFLAHTFPAEGPVSSIQEKTFEIRFKNRVTKREYIKMDRSKLPQTPLAGLTQKYNEFKILSQSMPDPGAALIFPKRVSNDPANVDYNKLETINSEIYLNK